MRVVSRFSCGAASAVATKLAIDKYGSIVSIVNAFIVEEEADNRRFLTDCEQWFGRSITVLRDEKYGASVESVWIKKRFIVSKQGAPCSAALKRDVLDAWSRPGDRMILGYTADARDVDRFERFIDANAGLDVEAPLIDAGLTKHDCFRIVTEAGLTLPNAYLLGFHNANCLECPRGGMGYWNKIRVVRPENFERVARIQDLLGPGSFFFRNRETKERISLRMLDPSAGRFTDEQPFECGATCEWPTQGDLFAEAP